MFLSLCSECHPSIILNSDKTFYVFLFWIIKYKNHFYFQGINKINFEIGCLSSERMNLALHAGKVADDINTNKKEEISDVVEEMELNSVTTQDVLMISPEKNIQSQNNISWEEETKTSQSGEVFLMYLNKVSLNK